MYGSRKKLSHHQGRLKFAYYASKAPSTIMSSETMVLGHQWGILMQFKSVFPGLSIMNLYSMEGFFVSRLYTASTSTGSPPSLPTCGSFDGTRGCATFIEGSGTDGISFDSKLRRIGFQADLILNFGMTFITFSLPFPSI